MKELLLILSLFRSEAGAQGVTFPDSVQIEYAVLGHDTLGVAHDRGAYWLVQISPTVEGDEILESVVWHELGHVAGLSHCRGRSLMNYGYMVPITQGMKRRLILQIKQFQTLCKSSTK
jgi:predicted Zn-dependent protease